MKRMKMHEKHMNLRRLLPVLLTVCVLATFVACSTDHGGSDTTTSTKNPTDSVVDPSEGDETATQAADTTADTQATDETDTTASDVPDIVVNNTDRSEETRKMDMIVWYDVDYGAATNSRPDNGWYYLYDETPGVITKDGLYRAATPLLGTYDQSEPEVARQHLYWLAAAGANAVLVDWTNYKSFTTVEDTSDWMRFYKGIYNNTALLLETARAMKAEGMTDVPKICIAVRMYGSDEEALRLVLDDVYSLYSQYPDELYHLNGGAQPFLDIFADMDVMQAMVQSNTFVEDERYDIRWTNGCYGMTFSTVQEGNTAGVSADRRVFLFWEPAIQENREGFYRSYYTIGADGSPEMMVGWVSFWGGWSADGSGWDTLTETYEGLTCFERTTADVENLMPSALLVGRFNYPLCWLSEPQEGLGLYHSGHFEPCEELGFEIFDIVASRLYELNDWNEAAPDTPVVTAVQNNCLFLDWSSYPLEYCLSAGEDFSDGVWQYINVNTGIDYTDYVDAGEVWIKTRNTFGESETVRLTLEDTSETIRVESGLIMEENFENWTPASLADRFILDGDGFANEGGTLYGTWITGRTVRYQNSDLRYYTAEICLKANDRASADAEAYKTAIALRLASDMSVASLAICEPDNGDADTTSYLGTQGIYLYTFGNHLEIAFHVVDDSRQLGCKGVAYTFTLPDGMSFTNGVTVRITDLGDEIRVYTDDVLICTVLLSDIGEIASSFRPSFNQDLSWSGLAYRHAEVVDAAGEVLLSADNCLTPLEGNFAVTERVNSFWIDSIKVWQHAYEIEKGSYILIDTPES